MTPRPTQRVLLGVALVCFANLALEIVVTRIFSAVMFYHFTFLAIAAALFGLGASGVYIYVRRKRYRIETADRDLANNALWFGITSVISICLILLAPLDVVAVKDMLGAGVLLRIAFLTVITFLPFFFSGMVVSLALFHYRGSVGKVYFFDLAAAAFAAAVVSIPIRLLGGPSAILFAAAIAAAGSIAFVKPPRWRLALAVAVMAVLPLNLATGIIDIPRVKSVKAKVVFERWNAQARITVEQGGGRGNIKIDSDASTAVSKFTDKSVANANKGIHGLAFSKFPEPIDKILIIGPGGGRDVVKALASGAKHVLGVEINSIIANDVMRGAFREASGDLYFHPQVQIVVDEGRSFIRRSSDRFDIIQATLVDTWAATAAGAFSLTENALYTLEAFLEYFEHLTEHGVVTMTRWYRTGGAETQRLVVLAAEALRARGVADADVRRHMFLAVQGGKKGLATLVVGRSPLSPGAIARLEKRCKDNRLRIILSPKGPGNLPLERLADQGASGEIAQNSRYDLSPPTDDRPFFFFYDRPEDMLSLGRLQREGDTWRSPGQWILAAFGLVISVLAILFIVLPLFLRRRKLARQREPGARLVRGCGLAFFSAIGFGFMIVEIAMLHKFGLFLGHPTYGLMVVLPAILVALALGARLTERLPRSRALIAVAPCAALVFVVALVYGGLLDGVLADWIAWPLIARILLAIVLCAIPAAAMGTMVPIGVRVLSDRDSDLIPWAWGLNGATSVVGTVAGTVFAIRLGFNGTLIAGGLCYVLAGGLAAAMIRVVDRQSSLGRLGDSDDEEEE